MLDWLKLLLAEDLEPEDLRPRRGQRVVRSCTARFLKNEQDVALFERLAFSGAAPAIGLCRVRRVHTPVQFCGARGRKTLRPSRNDAIFVTLDACNDMRFSQGTRPWQTALAGSTLGGRDRNRGPLEAADRSDWDRLWADYLAFYGTRRSPDIFGTTLRGAISTWARADMLAWVAVAEGACEALPMLIVHAHGWQVGARP